MPDESKVYSGSGATFEAAFEAAAGEALAAWESRGPDDMVGIELVYQRAMYGGIVGHWGTRVVGVRLPTRGAAAVAAAAAGRPAALGARVAAAGGLVCTLIAVPDRVRANLMPPVRRPQEHRVALLLSVTNEGEEEFDGSSPDSGVAVFTVSIGGKVVWRTPEITMPVVTPVRIGARETKTYSAVWTMADATELVGAQVRAVAVFRPTEDRAATTIVVDAVH